MLPITNEYLPANHQNIDNIEIEPDEFMYVRRMGEERLKPFWIYWVTCLTRYIQRVFN